MSKSHVAGLYGSTAAVALLGLLAPAMAQAQTTAGNEVVVTGSRIARTDAKSPAPVAIVTADDVTDRGFVQVGQMINQITSNVPSFPTLTGQGFPVLNGGKIAPNLFGLGSGRTLTLVNGRRMVASSSGLGDRSVDSNIIPVGLLDHVDVVEAGAAAVYGSDAIAGVVNYVLKKNFTGLTVDAQYGMSTYGDERQPSLRATFGKDFLGGRGNIAGEVEWSKTEPLLEKDRPYFAQGLGTITNPNNTSTFDGQPPTIYVQHTRLWAVNPNGVILTGNVGLSGALLGESGITDGKTPNFGYQFGPDGSVIPYAAGLIQPSSSRTVGGEGWDPLTFSSLAAGVERFTGNIIGHYDVTDHIKVSTELLYSKEMEVDPYGSESVLTYQGGNSGQGPYIFDKNNPYLTPQAIAKLTQLDPAFANGGTAGQLYLSKFQDILPTRALTGRTVTWRALQSVDGDFRRFDRDFNWSVSYSHGSTYITNSQWQANTQHLAQALNTTRNAAGQIVCGINVTVINDPACTPLNPFVDSATVPMATRLYVSAHSGQKYDNAQDDLLAVFGGDIVSLPAGKLKFSTSYEHRYEASKFKPFIANVTGVTFAGSITTPESGAFSTNEYAAEVLIPVVGGDFTLPLVQRLELNGSYRYVDNDAAGKESVYGFGGQWEVGWGLTIRGSRTHNFRAPSLDQLFAPQSFGGGNPLGSDPCDKTAINGGINPAVRAANCAALFAAHPGYGPLASFLDLSDNTGAVKLLTGGNPNLKNEISDTTTFGFVLQPKFVPGFTLSADRIEVNLTNALQALSVTNFVAQCMDSKSYPTDPACATFTRDATGNVVTGQSTTFNAGYLIYQGENINVNYRFGLENILFGHKWGLLALGVNVTHNAMFATQSAAGTVSRSEGTVSMPTIRLRFDANYYYGPIRLFYSAYYLPPSKNSYLATIETDPTPRIAANLQHTVSAQYTFGHYVLRAGVNNLTNAPPSYPTNGYGDTFGRQYFVGLKAKF